MATRETHGEQPGVSAPADHSPDHPEERPADWGWHGEFGVWAQVAGWVTVVILLLMMTTTHYNGQGALFLGLTAGLLVVGLLLERQRRKNAWRK